MKRKQQIKLLLMLIIIPIFLPIQTIFAQRNTQETDPIYLVTESQNGIILDQSRGNEVQDVGSLSKILAIYLIYNAIDQGKIKLDDIVPISNNAYTLSQDYNIDNIPLRPDGAYKVEELLSPMVMAQANGIIYALAELIAGSEEAFVGQMNQQLVDWGIENAEIYNVTGLPVGFEPNSDSSATTGKVNRMSAEALAISAYHLLNHHPEVLDFSGKAKGVFRNGTADIFDYHNAMMQLGYFNKVAADGLFMRSVGEENKQLSAIVTHQQGDMRTIMVLLDFEAEEFERFGTKLIQENDRKYIQDTIAQAGDAVSQINEINIYESGQKQAPLVYEKDFKVIIPREDIAPQILYTLKPDYQYFTTSNQLMAPVKKGTRVGYVEVATLDKQSNTKHVLPSLPKTPGNTVSIIVAEDVEKGNYSQSLNNIQESVNTVWREVRMFFVELFN